MPLLAVVLCCAACIGWQGCSGSAPETSDAAAAPGTASNPPAPEAPAEARKVDGLAEDAYTFGGGTIVFKKGNAEVMVITSGYKGEMSKFDAAKLIADKLVAKM